MLLVLRRPATLELATFSTMSKTGRRAVGTLLKHYDRLQNSTPGAYPAVRLKPGGYQDSSIRLGADSRISSSAWLPASRPTCPTRR